MKLLFLFLSLLLTGVTTTSSAKNEKKSEKLHNKFNKNKDKKNISHRNNKQQSHRHHYSNHHPWHPHRNISFITFDIKNIVFVDFEGQEENINIGKILKHSDLDETINDFTQELNPKKYEEIRIFLGESNSITYKNRKSETVSSPLKVGYLNPEKYITIKNPFYVLASLQTNLSIDFDFSRSISYSKKLGWYLRPKFKIKKTFKLLSSSDENECTEEIIQFGNDEDGWQIAKTVKKAIKKSEPGDTIDIKKQIIKKRIVIRNRNNLTIKSSCGSRVKSILVENSSNISISGLNVIKNKKKDPSLRIKGINGAIEIVGSKITNDLNFGNGLEVEGKSEKLTMIGNLFINNGGHGVDIEGEHNIEFMGNEFSSNIKTGLKVSGKIAGSISDNKFFRGK